MKQSIDCPAVSLTSHLQYGAKQIHIYLSLFVCACSCVKARANKKLFKALAFLFFCFKAASNSASWCWNCLVVQLFYSWVKLVYGLQTMKIQDCDSYTRKVSFASAVKFRQSERSTQAVIKFPSYCSHLKLNANITHRHHMVYHGQIYSTIYQPIFTIPTIAVNTIFKFSFPPTLLYHPSSFFFYAI